MHDVLSERAGELDRLAATIRSGLKQAEAMIPALNQQLAELDLLGVTRHQVEGPSLMGGLPACPMTRTTPRLYSKRSC